MYITALNSETVTSDATQDLWSLVAASANKCILHGWEITSDAIVATLLEITLLRVSGHGSGGNTSIDKVPLNSDDAAATASVNARNTTPGSPVANSILAGFQWEQLGPLGQIYTPEMRPILEVSTGIALVCNTADAFEMSGWVCWEEL